MLCLPVQTLPEGPGWEYEIKFDGYRAIGISSDGAVRLFSRNGSYFNHRFPTIAMALGELPKRTVIDGEVVAVGDDGRPSFNRLQNFYKAPLLFYTFDLPVLAGEDLMKRPLRERRALLSRVVRRLDGPIRFSETFDASAAEMIAAMREQGLEGVVAKRLDSRYEPGRRSGAWVKLRVNRSAELVIGGYIPSGTNFDSILVGRYEGRQLMYAAQVRAGFVPELRRRVFEAFDGLSISACPFANLPDSSKGRWGEGLTAADMAKCRWLGPHLVATIEFLEWTPAGRLRHSRFVALKESEGINRK